MAPSLPTPAHTRHKEGKRRDTATALQVPLPLTSAPLPAWGLGPCSIHRREICLTFERQRGLIDKPPSGLASRRVTRLTWNSDSGKRRRWPRNAVGLQHVGPSEGCRPGRPTTEGQDRRPGGALSRRHSPGELSGWGSEILELPQLSVCSWTHLSGFLAKRLGPNRHLVGVLPG